jgi:hypothetical protein
MLSGYVLIDLAAVGHHVIQEQEKGAAGQEYRGCPDDHNRKSDKGNNIVDTAHRLLLEYQGSAVTVNKLPPLRALLI